MEVLRFSCHVYTELHSHKTIISRHSSVLHFPHLLDLALRRLCSDLFWCRWGDRHTTQEIGRWRLLRRFVVWHLRCRVRMCYSTMFVGYATPEFLSFIIFSELLFVYFASHVEWCVCVQVQLFRLHSVSSQNWHGLLSCVESSWTHRNFTLIVVLTKFEWTNRESVTSFSGWTQ